MPVPTINEDFEFEQVASGASYSKQLTATESPTSWSLSGAPSGLSINSSGLITGTPIVTAATAYTMSVTATNGSGDSDAETWLLVVQASPTGASQNDFGRPIDIDMDTGKLRLPGRTDWQPADRPPTSGEGTAESALAAWKSGDRFLLEIGVVKNEVLQAPTIDWATVVLKEFEPETDYVISEGSVSTQGAGTSRRYVVPVYLNPDDFISPLSNNEADKFTAFDGRLEITLGQYHPAIDFDSGESQYNIVSNLDQGETHSNTFDMDLDDEVNGRYDLTVQLLVPGDRSLEATITSVLEVAWDVDGSTFSVFMGGDLQTATGSSTVADDWDTTLELTSVTGDATGLQVATKVTTTEQVSARDITIDMEGGWTVSTGVGPYIVAGTAGQNDWEFYDEDDNLLWTWEPEDGDDDTIITADFLAGLGEAITSNLSDANENIVIDLPLDTAVSYAVNTHSATQDDVVSTSGGPSYSGCQITCQVVGQADQAGYEISSLAAPLQVARKLKEDEA